MLIAGQGGKDPSMADDSLRHRTQLKLREARAQTAMGRTADSAGPGGALYPDLDNPAALSDFMNFLIVQINALNEIVVELAAQVDRLRGT
jgi:hypothetical protein